MNTAWSRAAAAVQLITLASSHPKPIFTQVSLALGEVPWQVCRKLATLLEGSRLATFRCLNT